MGRVVNSLIVAVVAVVAYALFTDRLTQFQSICFNFSNNVQEAREAGRFQTEFPDLLRTFGQDLVRALTQSKGKTAGNLVDDLKAKRADLSEFFAKIQKVDDDSTDSDGNITPVTAWKINRSPFSEGSDGITGHAELGSGSGHANVTITRRDDGTPVFTVGIPNGQLDIHYTTSEPWLRVDFKLDSFTPGWIKCPMDTQNSFWFSCYIPQYFISKTSFLIGFSMAGEKTVLRIPLRDATVAAFLAQCQQVAISHDNTEDDSQ
jgi:hypothetical protein